MPLKMAWAKASCLEFWRAGMDIVSDIPEWPFTLYSRFSERLCWPGHGHDLTKIGICPSAAIAIGFNSIGASDSWCRCQKRNYAMSIKRLFDAVERRGDIGRRVAGLVLPISNRPRVTSSCTGKIRLREPGEHTSGPNLASRDNVAHNQTLYTILETPLPVIPLWGRAAPLIATSTSSLQRHRPMSPLSSPP